MATPEELLNAGTIGYNPPPPDAPEPDKPKVKPTVALPAPSEPDPNKTALGDPRVKDFLDRIGTAEGADYNTLVGGRKIGDLSRHPNTVGMRTSAGPSTAFGKYQITYTTHKTKLAQYADRDYSPENQDLRAVELLRQTGALDDIQNDRPDVAVRKAGREWASLPGSRLPGHKNARAFAGVGGNGQVKTADLLAAGTVDSLDEQIAAQEKVVADKRAAMESAQGAFRSAAYSPDELLAAGTVQEPSSRPSPPTRAAPTETATVGPPLPAVSVAGERPPLLTERNREAITRPRVVPQNPTIAPPQAPIVPSQPEIVPPQPDSVPPEQRARIDALTAHPEDQEFGGMSVDEKAAYAQRQAQPVAIDEMNARMLAKMAADHRAELIRKQAQQKLSGEDWNVKKAIKDPAKLAANLDWHFGKDSVQKMATLPAAQQRQMILIATAAGERDDAKKAADPTFQPQPSPEYQAKMHKRIPGLAQAQKPIDELPTTDAPIPTAERAQADQGTAGFAGNAQIGINRPLARAQRDEANQQDRIIQEETNRTVMPGDKALSTRLIDRGLDVGTVRHVMASQNVRDQVRGQLKDEGVLGKIETWMSDPLGPFHKTRELMTEEEINRRVDAVAQASTPEMLAERKDWGTQPAGVRAVLQPAARAGAGLVRTLAGLSAFGGLVPNEASDYLNQRAQFLEQGTLNSPLTPEGKEIVRGLPEKGVAAVLDLGFTVAEIVALKKATRLPLGQLLAAETALKTNNLPASERAPKVALAYLNGNVLEAELSRPLSALVFGGPTAIQSGLAVAGGRMSVEDALLQTGIQTGAGAILGGGGVRQIVGEGAARVLASDSAPEWARRAADWWTNYQAEQAKAGPEAGQDRAKYPGHRAKYAEQQANMEAALNDIRGRENVSPEAKAFYSGADPRNYGTTNESVRAYAARFGIPWEPDPRWVAAEQGAATAPPEAATEAKPTAPPPSEPAAPEEDVSSALRKRIEERKAAAATSSPKAVIEAAGMQYLGEQQMPKGGVSHMFNDPQTGSTLMLRPDQVTPEGVQAHVEASRAKLTGETNATETRQRPEDVASELSRTPARADVRANAEEIGQSGGAETDAGDRAVTAAAGRRDVGGNAGQRDSGEIAAAAPDGSATRQPVSAGSDANAPVTPIGRRGTPAKYGGQPQAEEMMRSGNAVPIDEAAEQARDSWSRGKPTDISREEARSLKENADSPTIPVYRVMPEGENRLAPGDFVGLSEGGVRTYLSKGLHVVKFDVPREQVVHVDRKGPWPIRYSPQGARTEAHAQELGLGPEATLQGTPVTQPLPSATPKQLRTDLAAVNKELVTLRATHPTAEAVASGDPSLITAHEEKIRSKEAYRDSIVTAIREATVGGGQKAAASTNAPNSLANTNPPLEAIYRQRLEAGEPAETKYEENWRKSRKALAAPVEASTVRPRSEVERELADTQQRALEVNNQIRGAERIAPSNDPAIRKIQEDSLAKNKTEAQSLASKLRFLNAELERATSPEKPSVTTSIKTAATEAGMGLHEAGKGLMELFKSGAKGGTHGAGPVFDDETYEKAKPFLIAGMKHFYKSGMSMADAARAFVDWLMDVMNMAIEAVERLEPYIVRFLDDFKAGKIDMGAETVDAEARPGPTDLQKPETTWQEFAPETGTLGIPRAAMPQVKSVHRGAMVQFLKGRGVSWEHEEAAPNTLKPSQGEFSPEKVEKARGFDNEDRAILVSSDNYVVDGHHQWLQKLQDAPDTPIPIIRLGLPIQPLLLEMARFPSSGVSSTHHDTPAVAAPTDYGTIDAPNVPGLSEAFSKHFLEGQGFKNIGEARKFASDLLGDRVEPGTQAAKAVDEAVELGVVRAARQSIADDKAVLPPATEQEVYRDMLDLYDQQPNLGVKTSTSVQNQAYSTPVPLAYIASRLAGITQNTTVYEPTAGNGALLIEANPRAVVANEKDADRQANLEALLPDANIQGNDATEWSVNPKQSDVVIANPPFGVNRENGEIQRYQISDAYETTQIDHAIAMKALSAMKDDGHAVLILGGIKEDGDVARSKGYQGADKRAFYFDLYQQYNVVDHFTVDGDLYRKQGAGWPVDVVVIYGRGKSHRRLPAADVPRIYKSWDQLEGVLNEPYRKSLDAAAQSAGSEPISTAESGSGERPGGRATQRPDLPEQVDGQGDSSIEAGAGPGGSVRRPVGQTGASGAGLGHGPRGTPEPGPESTAAVSGGGSVAEDDRPSDTGTAAADLSGKRPQGAGDLRGNESGELAGQPARAGSKRGPVEAVDVTKTQVPYNASSKVSKSETLVPVNMKSAVQRALDRAVDRLGDLDDFVARELGYKSKDLGKYFSAEQVDGAALAIDNMQRDSGMIIGDQGGIGKGRTMAAVIKYAGKQKRTMIFVTEGPGLFKDIVRDLVNIGYGTREDWAKWALMTNNGQEVALDDEGKVVLKSQGAAAHQAKLKRLRETGSLGGHKVIFTTYHQMQNVTNAKTKESPPTERQLFLRHFADGAIIAFDESHNAAGQAQKRITARQKQLAAMYPDRAVDRAGFARELIDKAHGVVYSSATYAKNPNSMTLYSKTNMRLAVDKPAQIAEAITKGGVPLQQITASMLAEDGQMIRRERDMSGLTYETQTVPVDRKVANDVASAMQSIRTFDQIADDAFHNLNDQLLDTGHAAGVNIATGVAGMQSTTFSSLMHNLIADMSMMLKVDGVADAAIESLKSGKKPVIVVSKTMGSFIGKYVGDHGLSPGDAIDINFGNILHRYLEASRTITVKGPHGEQTPHYMTDDQLGPAGVAAYDAAKNFIDGHDWSSMPVSPIDYIKERIQKAGHSIGEITGREHAIDYGIRKRTTATADRDPLATAKQAQLATYFKRPAIDRTAAGKNRTIVKFNNDEFNAIIINQSGSTGISLHASHEFKNVDQRHMIIAQPHLNIDVFMQTLWRVDRKGQVVLPTYTLLSGDIPAELRPAAVLKGKMASLNANTTAAKGSAYESEHMPDFMNKYGDQVAAQIMHDNPDVHTAIGRPLKANDAGTGLKEEAAVRKVTGRLALLPLKEQERVYAMLISEYDELIKRLDAMGENSLEAKTLNLGAKELKRTEIFSGKGDSAFAKSAYAAEMDVKKIGKPFTSKEVIEQVAKSVGGSPDEGLSSLQRKGDAQMGQLEEDVREKFQEYAHGILDEIEDESKAAARRVILDGQFSLWYEAIQDFPVGAMISASVGHGENVSEVGGVVTKVEQKGSPQNPAAMGTWKITMAVTDASRHVTFPLSQVQEVSPLHKAIARKDDRMQSVPLMEAFDLGQSDVRENRTIMTGNLFAAFTQFPKGRFINFTDEAGQVQPGIMMAVDFNVERELEGQKAEFAKPEHVIQFLREGNGRRLVESLPEHALRLTWENGRLRIATKVGGFRGRSPSYARLLDATSDEFVKSGQNMVMYVDSADAENAVRALLESNISLHTDSFKEAARDITGDQLPTSTQTDAGQRGSVGLRGPTPTGYEGGGGRGLPRELAARARGAFNAIRGREGEGRQKYSAIGNLRDIWVGNLSQLEKANQPTFEDALRAAGAKTTGKMLMRRAANQIQAILKTKDGWDLFRQALVENRLIGIQDRWKDFQDLAHNLPEAEFKEFYAGDGAAHGIRPIVAMLEGMPFGKQFKEDEGFNPDDSIAGMVDSLLATDDVNAARTYLSNLFGAAADSVTHVMEPDDFDAFTHSDDFGKALPVYKDLLERPMTEAHSLNEGVFSDARGPLDTYYPLTPLDDQGNIMRRIAGSIVRGREYRTPANPRNKFATGLSPDYDLTPEALSSAMSKAERMNSVARLLRTAEKEGLVKTLKRNEAPPETIEYQGEEYFAKTVPKGPDRMIVQPGGKTIHVAAPRLAVPNWLYDELAPILETGDYSQGNFVRFMSKMNTWAMAGLIMPAIHVANITGAMVVGTPYVGRDILSKTIGNTPVTKLLTSWLNIAFTDPWSDDAVKDIEAMSKMGVVPSRYATVTSGWLAKGRQFAGQTGAKKQYFSLGPLLYGPGGVDIRARLLMYRAAKQFAPGATIAEQKHFIDQMGNYTNELHGKVERWLKKYGLSPFYTAGSTMWRTGIKATFGATPLPTNGNSFARRLILRMAVMLSAGIVGMVGLWIATHKAYTGKWPWEDERAKLLQIPLNDKHRHHWLADKIYGKNDKTAYVGLGFFSPLIERGLTATGIGPALDAYHQNATKGQAAEEGYRQIVNSAIHPFLGPIPRAATVLATGKEPYVTGFRDFTGKPAVNLLPAAQTTQPGISTIKARGIQSVASLNSFYGDIAKHIGLVSEPYGTPAERESGPNPWLRSIINLAAPRLIKGPVDVDKKSEQYQKNQKAIDSSVRRAEGDAPIKHTKAGGPHGPKGPGKGR